MGIRKNDEADASTNDQTVTPPDPAAPAAPDPAADPDPAATAAAPGPGDVMPDETPDASPDAKPVDADPDVDPPGNPDSPADVANHAAALATGGSLGGPADQVQARLERSQEILARDQAIADGKDPGPAPDPLPQLVGSVEHGQSPSVPTAAAPGPGVSTGEIPDHLDPYGGHPPVERDAEDGE